MKKLLLVVCFSIFIGCSLDSFKSENLASWSVNLDLPLFKANYTVEEMLKDYDELGVEYYDEHDSIYVFNVTTPIDIDVPNTILVKDGNSITPIPVIIPDYELEIPTLPEEVNGINFVDVDLTLEVDLSLFNINLADSVIVNTIFITATNDNGDIAPATITNQDIKKNGILVVEDPEDLINIRPTSVIISGDITVYPSGLEGDQFFGQTIILISKLHAPLILEITETSTFESNPDKIGGNVEDTPFESVTLFAEIENQMEIGGRMYFLLSPDTMDFKPNSFIKPDTLLSIQLLPSQFQTETIELGKDKFDLLADSTYMKAIFNFIGMTDNQDNPEPTRLFTNDSIKVLFYSEAEVLIDLQDTGRED